MTLKRLRITVLCSLAAITGASCPPTSGPVISPNDTFVFSYIDRTGVVHSRWSQDGWRWEESDLTTPPIHDSGVGSAAHVDNVGITRYVAYPSVSGRLILHAAIGAVFDSGGGREFPAVRTRGAPTMTAISGGNWVVATLGGNLNQAAIFNLFDAPNAITDISPPNAGGIQNDQLNRPPQIMSRGGTFVAAWMRWLAVGAIRVPLDVRVLRGTDSGGTINWSGSSLFSNTETGFSAPIADPALTHDGNVFLLGVVRRENSGGDEHLFIYRSTDAITWTLADQLEVPFGQGTTVRMAAHGNEKMFIGVNGISSASFYRKWKGEWEHVRGANVFGTARPDWYRFSIIAAGLPRNDIYVDGSATVVGKGTQAEPYQTILEATNDAHRGDRILLSAGGNYTDRVTLPAGVTIEGTGGTPAIVTTGFSPSITAEGDNYIKNLVIRNFADASAGIHVNLATAFDGLEGNGSAAYLDVEDTIIGTQNFGVEVVSAAGMDFGAGNERVFRPRIKHNKFTGHAMGIKVEVIGPSTGSVQLPLEIYDNLFDTNFTGIRLLIEGGGPNFGGFALSRLTGRIRNNLIIDGANGISLDARNAGTILTPLHFNTIARNNQHNVVCGADPGPFGQSRVRTRLYCNVIADAGQFGFIEFTDNCDPNQVTNNLFFSNNSANYDKFNAISLNTAAQINTATGGSGNIVADPLFEQGGYRFGNSIDFGDPGDFFLTQSGGTLSSAVDLCPAISTLEMNDMDGRSTRTDYVPDTDPPDAGFHYIP